MNPSQALNFQTIPTVRDGERPSAINQLFTARARVPGGWLVTVGGVAGYGALTFYPDPEHKWDGRSLD